MNDIREFALIQLDEAIKFVTPLTTEVDENLLVKQYLELMNQHCTSQMSALNAFVSHGLIKQEELDELTDDRILEEIYSGTGIKAIRDKGYSWYSNKSNGTWAHYKRYLSSKGFKDEDIDEIDSSTSRMLSSVEDPQINGKFSQKGLVIGNIQSGKTANFTGLISKFIDYKVDYIVVFTGIHNTLRNQTQKRIENDIIGRTLSLEGSYEDVGIGKMFESYNSNATMITTTYEDIKSGFNRDLDAEGSDKTKIFIVKKNVSTLINLKKLFISVTDANKSILIIDDEADNASIDTNANKDDKDETATNASIRSLLQLFDRSFYIAYTATPYANIFINKETMSEKLDDDLFPRDFIVKLEASDSYTGYDKYFNTSYKDNLVVNISDVIENDRFDDALIDFMMAAALKKYMYLNNDDFMWFKDRHGTMLVHTSHLKTEHHAQNDYIKDLLDEYCSKLRFFDDQEIIKRLHLSFENARSAYLKISGNILDIDFDEVVKQLKSMIANDEFIINVNNSDTDEVLDYDDDFKTYIVIGGNTLSRGLTLEGLIVSYFGRVSNTMDTMSQMARWFGYRANYLFMTKVYIQKIGVEYFDNIAKVDALINEQLIEMHEYNQSPVEFSFLISKFGKLNPTSKDKIGGATQKAFSFSGDGPQITGLDTSKFYTNKALVDEFMSHYEIEEKNKDYKVTNVDNHALIDFLQKFSMINNEPSLYSVRTNVNSWIEYIQEKNDLENPELTNWTVVLKGKQEVENVEEFSFGSLNFVNRSTSKIPNAEENLRRSRIISAPQDESLDLDQQMTDRRAAREERSPQSGLLIIYGVHAKDDNFTSNAFTLAISFPFTKIETELEINGYKN